MRPVGGYGSLERPTTCGSPVSIGPVGGYASSADEDDGLFLVDEDDVGIDPVLSRPNEGARKAPTPII